MPHLVNHRSRSRIPDFSLLRPRSMVEARAMLDGPDAVPIAGGLDIVNRMKEGFAPKTLVALAGIRNFEAIRLSPEQDTIDIGAGACHDALATSGLMRAWPTFSGCANCSPSSGRTWCTIKARTTTSLPRCARRPAAGSAGGCSICRWR